MFLLYTVYIIIEYFLFKHPFKEVIFFDYILPSRQKLFLISKSKHLRVWLYLSRSHDSLLSCCNKNKSHKHCVVCPTGQDTLPLLQLLTDVVLKNFFFSRYKIYVHHIYDKLQSHLQNNCRITQKGKVFKDFKAPTIRLKIWPTLSTFLPHPNYERRKKQIS